MCIERKWGPRKAGLEKKGYLFTSPQFMGFESQAINSGLLPQDNRVPHIR